MKTLAVIMVALLIFSTIATFATFAFAKGLNSGDLRISGKTVFADSNVETSEDISITTDLDVGDIIESEAELEKEIQAEIESETRREVSFPALYYGQGWAAASDGRAALANILWIEKTFLGPDDSVTKTSFHGRLRIGEIKLKAEGTESSDSQKTFLISGPNNLQGTLKLMKEKQYDGVSIWKGPIVIEEIGDVDDTLRGEITLAIKEKRVKPQVIPEVKENTFYNWYGNMQLDQLYFKFQGKQKANQNKINFQIVGQNGEEGKMTISVVEKSEDRKVTYNGEIVIVGDDGDDKIEGQVLITADLKTGEGVIAIKTRNSGTIKGEIKLWKEGVYTEKHPKDAPSVDYEKEFRDKAKYEVRTDKDAESESETEVKYKDKGFWIKVKSFFGLQKQE